MILNAKFGLWALVIMAFLGASSGAAGRANDRIGAKTGEVKAQRVQKPSGRKAGRPGRAKDKAGAVERPRQKLADGRRPRFSGGAHRSRFAGGQRRTPRVHRYSYRPAYRSYVHRRPYYWSRPHYWPRGPYYRVPPHRIRYYRQIVVVRPYGHWYYGYGHYRTDLAAYHWLGFTAITLRLYDNMSVDQQRAHEAAQVRASEADVGDRIVWSDGETQGEVVATREGTSSDGRYCREFQHSITVGGKTEQAYGVACRQPDGAWEVISTGEGN